MENNTAENIRQMFEFLYKQEKGNDVFAVLNPTPGEYDNNQIIIDNQNKGYKLIDANMFGQDNDTYEVLIFAPDKN